MKLSLPGNKLWWALGGAGALLLLLRPSMAPGQVPATRTGLSRAAATAALRDALRTVLGREPTAAELKMLVAQSDLETRGWQAMWNWNFGNATVSSTTTSAWFKIPGDASHRYRNFSSAADGAGYYVRLLKNTFTKAWALLGSGNTAAFAQALKDQKYYEAPVATYASGLASRYKMA